MTVEELQDILKAQKVFELTPGTRYIAMLPLDVSDKAIEATIQTLLKHDVKHVMLCRGNLHLYEVKP